MRDAGCAVRDWDERFTSQTGKEREKGERRAVGEQERGGGEEGRERGRKEERVRCLETETMGPSYYQFQHCSYTNINYYTKRWYYTNM